MAGHTRLKAAEQLGMDEVPTICADDLTEDQIRAFRLADNKTAEIAEWDFSALDEELEELGHFDMERFGFEFPPDDEPEEEKYTEKTDIPQYEVVGEKPEIEELVDEEKTNELLEEIENSSLGSKEKQFLRKAAQRHLAFNYKKVAEYYAQAEEEMQKLMERSALVIIDYNDAIMNGYTKLSATIKKMLEAEKTKENA